MRQIKRMCQHDSVLPNCPVLGIKQTGIQRELVAMAIGVEQVVKGRKTDETEKI